MKEIPKRTMRERVKLMFLIPLLLLQWKLIEGFGGTLLLSLYDLVGYVIASLAVIGVMWIVLRKTAFKPNKAAVWMIFGLALWSIMIFIGLELAGRHVWPEGPHIEMHGTSAYDVLAAAGLVILLASLFWTSFKKLYRRPKQS
ncbi:hypothetical protein JCM16163A_23010 [Paenibacillus sp. YK5]